MQSLRDGLCKELYRDLPDVTFAEYEATYSDSESGYDDYEDYNESNPSMEDVEYEPLLDVVLEAYGPQIDIALCAIAAEPDIDDFCSICQSAMTLNGSDPCVITISCSHVFHADDLSGWVNSTDNNSNRRPNCKEVVTSRQRPCRAAQ